MEENIIKRIPPHSDEAERSVLGAMLMNEDAIITALDMLTGEDFYQRQYGIMFDAIKELYDRNVAVDAVTLTNKLKEKDLPPETASLDYVREALGTVPISANAKHYAKIVRDKALLRRLIDTARAIEDDCFLEQEEVDEILDKTESSVFTVLQQKQDNNFKPIKEIVHETLRNIEKAAKTQSHVTGLATGFYDLDYKTTGMQPSDLILLAARPSMGKTSLALNIAMNMALKQNIPVAVFSLEMSKEQLMNRLLAMDSQIDAQRLRTGQLKGDEWDKLMTSGTQMQKASIVIDDTPGLTISQLRSKARKYKVEFGIQMIFIDYLQLMQGNGRTDNRQQEVSEISRSLKALARELNVPIMALSQLNRSPEQREDKRPILSDLRESGAIEQDADVVMFIYRDEYYHKDSPDKDIAEVIVAKQRNGPTGTVKLIFMKQLTKFANLKVK